MTTFEIDQQLYQLVSVPPSVWRVRRTDRPVLFEYVTSDEVEALQTLIASHDNIIAVFQAEPEDQPRDENHEPLTLTELALVMRHDGVTSVAYGIKPTGFTKPEMPHRMMLAHPDYDVTLQYQRLRKLHLLLD